MAKTEDKKKPTKPEAKKANAGHANKKVPKEPPNTYNTSQFIISK